MEFLVGTESRAAGIGLVLFDASAVASFNCFSLSILLELMALLSTIAA